MQQEQAEGDHDQAERQHLRERLDDGVDHSHDGRHPEHDQDVLLVCLGDDSDPGNEPDRSCGCDCPHDKPQKHSHASTVPAYRAVLGLMTGYRPPMERMTGIEPA